MRLKTTDTPGVTGTAQTANTGGRQPLTETEAAARLGLKVATLRGWRHQGRGPAYVRLGRAIRYLAIDIEEFLNSNRHRPQSDYESSSHIG
jgi:predicted DNA-binding transcriptional regulator AlpA